jgi:hypothetical protein
MKIINTGVSVTAYDAPRVAKESGGRPARHAEVDKYKMDGNSGAYWAGWAAKRVLIEKGKDLVDEKTGVRIEAKDVQKMLELQKALEEKLGMEIPIEKLVYLLDPEGFELKNGLYVHQNPKITVVQNAVLEMGGRGMADPETKIAVYAAKEILDSLPSDQIRWNFINDGVWPLARGGNFLDDYFRRYVIGNIHPSDRFRVLSIKEDAKVDAPKKVDTQETKAATVTKEVAETRKIEIVAPERAAFILGSAYQELNALPENGRKNILAVLDWVANGLNLQ